MAAYKVGDEVLVRARVARLGDGDVLLKYPDGAGEWWASYDNIHSLAPKPKVDWSAVPMGARVRVRDFEHESWMLGRLVSYDQRPGDAAYQVLLDGFDYHVDWFPFCELVEIGDE